MAIMLPKGTHRIKSLLSVNMANWLLVGCDEN
ncbi:hypothetical protein COLO4_32590 [Corchorus olitorius]|uniref:Uncharacterized protein n=1 Tax=Corchorus olitorius TaxID=93759 RepID=A0A1R3GYV1_9ROSI|nr:hypothetical protein COLO4_32590 [Corchorus olitorius]